MENVHTRGLANTKRKDDSGYSRADKLSYPRVEGAYQEVRQELLERISAKYMKNKTDDARTTLGEYSTCNGLAGVSTITCSVKGFLTLLLVEAALPSKTAAMSTVTPQEGRSAVLLNVRL